MGQGSFSSEAEGFTLGPNLGAGPPPVDGMGLGPYLACPRLLEKG